MEQGSLTDRTACGTDTWVVASETAYVRLASLPAGRAAPDVRGLSSYGFVP